MLLRFLRESLKVFKSIQKVSISMEVPAMATERGKRKSDGKDFCEDSVEAKKLKTEDCVEKSAISEPQPPVQKRKSKKVAVLLCYFGKNYYGMQKNHGVHTVEEDLLNALLKANIILPDECSTPKNMKFQRAARTDKGVSAIRQTVSLKIPLNDITDAFPEKVNQHLPPEIKILCLKRVTQSFDAKIACDARSYSYMLPTFAFCDTEEVNQEDFRISEERIQEVNEFLKTYLGTQNFYNFTSGRLPNDASCKRYIMSCECGSPFEKEGLQFVIIKVKGQSFMLHQIRKMIGLAIAVLRKFVPASDILEKVWKTDRVDIPMAPGLGLMLEEVHYDWYNKKYGGDGLHEALKWDSCQDIINTFREEQVYQSIASTERNEKSMLQWLQTLPFHTFDIRDPQAPTPLPSKPVPEIVEKE